MRRTSEPIEPGSDDWKAMVALLRMAVNWADEYSIVLSDNERATLDYFGVARGHLTNAKVL